MGGLQRVYSRREVLRFGLAGAGLLGASGWLAACQPSPGAPAPTSGGGPGFEGSVTVGISTTLSGSIASLGQSGLQGVQLAIADLNARGGVLKKEVKLVYADDAAKPDQGATNVRNMILNDRVVAVFGPVSSAVAAAETGIAAQYRKPIFFFTSNDLVLTTKQFHKYAFQVVPNTYMEPRAIAEYLSQQPYRKYYTISPDYNYGRDSVEVFLNAMKDFGANIEVLGQQWPKLGTTDFSTYISAALAAKPDFVVMFIYGGDLLTFTKQAKGYGFFEQVKAGGPWDLTLLPALKTEAPAGHVSWSRAPFFAIDTPEVKDFVSRYRARYNEWPTEWSLLGYTAVQTWAWGVQKAGSFEGDPVADALAGATVPTIRGSITLRKCDHQAEIPEYIGTIAASPHPEYGFPILEKIFVAHPERILLSCDEAQKLQPR
jgi:branched-chain amino acid transport system substrate-binding protein